MNKHLRLLSLIPRFIFTCKNWNETFSDWHLRTYRYPIAWHPARYNPEPLPIPESHGIDFTQAYKSFETWTAEAPPSEPTIAPEAQSHFKHRQFVGYEAGRDLYVVALNLHGVMLERWQVHGDALEVADFDSSVISPEHVYNHFNPISSE